MAKKKVEVDSAPQQEGEIDKIITVATLALHDMNLAESLWDDLTETEQRKVEQMLDTYFTQKLVSGFISELYGKEPDSDTIVYTIGTVPKKKGKRSIKHPKESKK